MVHFSAYCYQKNCGEIVCLIIASAKFYSSRIHSKKLSKPFFGLFFSLSDVFKNSMLSGRSIPDYVVEDCFSIHKYFYIVLNSHDQY